MRYRTLLLLANLPAVASPTWAHRHQYGPGARAAIQRQFRTLDASRDGRLSPEELDDDARFALLDEDRDSFVSPEEASRLADVDIRARLKADPKDARPHGEEARVVGLDPGVLGQMDAVLAKCVDAGDAAGYVALIGRHGEVAYLEAFGWRDNESRDQMKTDAIFRIYSMTKPVVAVAAMSLWEEGRFRLDDPIHTYLPEWRSPTVGIAGRADRRGWAHALYAVPAENEITVRDLLRHTSGLSYDPWQDVSGSRVSPVARGVVFDVSLDVFSQVLARVPLVCQPGTKYEYGHSFDILGRYLEAVSGQTLDELLAERIFEPLEMGDTGFYVPAADGKRLAAIYRKDRAGALVPSSTLIDPTNKPELLLGGEGLVSTAEDYARFCQMLLSRGELDGIRVLQPETVEQMFENQLAELYPHASKCHGFGAFADGKGYYSWGGSACTEFWIDADKELLAVFMVQAEGYLSQGFRAFERMTYEALEAGSVGGAHEATSRG